MGAIRGKHKKHTDNHKFKHLQTKIIE